MTLSTTTTHQSLFTPATICFTIACTAFSLVAISAFWRDHGQDHHHQRTATATTTATAVEVEGRRVRPQPKRRRRAVDSIYVVEGEVNADGEERKSRYARLAELVSLAGDVSQMAVSTAAAGPEVQGLLGELALLVGVLCRLQGEMLGSGEEKFLGRGGDGGREACFDAAVMSILESLRAARGALLEGRYGDEDVERSVVQLRAQRAVLEWLVQEADVKGTEGLEEGQQTPDLVSSAAFEEEEHIGITPAVDDRCFVDPPPEYSPPAEGVEAGVKQKSQSPAPTAKPFNSDRLFSAVNANDANTLSELLSSGADASTTFGELRRTPLHIAAHLNHVQSLALLLKCGAVELSTEDAKGDTALHLAAWAGNVEALSLLLTHSAEVDFLSGRDGYSPLWCAISATQIDAVRLLLKHGARVSLRSAGGGGLMPLHQAAVMGQSAMCELLLERGAQVDCGDDDQNTPLHYAAASGSLASVKVLRRGGASLEARQNYGLTAVHWAAHKGHAEVIEVLLNCGANVDCRAKEGATPLHLAASRGHVAAAKMLLERGASRRPGSATWDGVSGTPAEMAKAKGHNRLVRLLRS